LFKRYSNFTHVLIQL